MLAFNLCFCVYCWWSYVSLCVYVFLPKHIFQKWKLSGSTQQRAVKVLCVQHLFYLHDVLWPLPKNLYVYSSDRIVYIFIVAMDLSFTFFVNPILIYDIFIWIIFDSEISLALHTLSLSLYLFVCVFWSAFVSNACVCIS